MALRRGNRAAVWYRGVRQSIGEMLGGIGHPIPLAGELAEANGESLAFDAEARGYYTLGEGFNQPLFAFRRLDAGAPARPVALIGAGETWRYRDQGTDEGTVWRQPEFDDASWAAGLAQLGYGQGDERAIVSFGTTNSNRHVTTYFRKTFMAAATALTNSLVLRLCFTDGAAVYLNGVEVFRRNLISNATFNQLADGSNSQLQNHWCAMPVHPSLLRAGANTLAIELHRQSVAGSALSFDAQLISGAFDRTPDGTDPAEPADSTPPRVAFTAPLAGAIVTNEVLTVRGTATDNIGLARVEWRTSTDDFQLTTGTKTWLASVPLEVGTNLVEVRAWDFRTNASTPAVRRIIRRAISQLIVERNGLGVVTPTLNGATLLVGNTYTLTAMPAARHLFAGWSEGVSSNAARLTFLMQSNLVLRANFVTNPFIAAKGLYRGLFEDTNVVSHDRSGALTVTVTEGGKFTAALRFGGRTASVAGQFDLAGDSSRTISVPGVGSLSVTLHLDLINGTDKITGAINGPDWTAQVLAYRAPVFTLANPSPHTGRHTMAVKNGTSVAALLGHGVGSFNVAASGLATLSGTLADGTVLAQAAPVSREGLWPLYLPLYKARGSALGWLTFTKNAVTSLTGAIHWVRLGEPGARPISEGFTNTVSALGSPYSVSAATNFLNGASNLCVVVNGLASEAQTNCLRQVTRGTFNGPGFRTLALNLATGLWSGSYTNPAGGGVLPAKFTVLLPAGLGFGHVLGTNFSAGLEWITP